MTVLSSGPSIERMVRSFLLFLFVAVFGGAFLADGYFGYAENNVRQLVKTLGRPVGDLPKSDPQFTAAAARLLIEQLEADTDRREMAERLGPPAMEQDGVLYYLGPGGHMRLGLEGERVVSSAWVDGIHSETDIDMQRWLGLVLSVVAAGFVVNFLRVARFRTTVTDEGLRLGGAPLIPFHLMKGLRRDPASAAGRFLLEWEDGGTQRAVVLDAYHIKRLDDVVEALKARADLTDDSIPETSPSQEGQTPIEDAEERDPG